jgi:putative ABC transport system permease protein
MTAFLWRLLGRLPVGWLQLTHNKGRLAAALAGVAFANILVLVQLGIMGSMNTTTRDSYAMFNADILISAADANTLSEGANVPRQWLFQALADPGVTDAAALFVGDAVWERVNGSARLRVLAIDPDQADFFVSDIASRGELLRLPDTGLIDRATRGMNEQELSQIRPQAPLSVELAGQRLVFAATFAVGGSFGADGYMVTSDQNFLRLMPSRSAGAPDHILLQTASSHQPRVVAERLAVSLPSDVRVRTLDDAADADVTYQNTERPTGLIFGFGVLMGIIVGIVIVYQVLASDVADHLGEYATFKAMGYGPKFFFGVIVEEALVLGLLGFVPGILVASLVFQFLGEATGLPMALEPGTVALVFVGTLVAATVSGALAARRLNSVDPAELF